MDFFSDSIRELSLAGLAACGEVVVSLSLSPHGDVPAHDLACFCIHSLLDVYRALLVHMRWSIEDSISLLRFLCNQRQSSNLLADEDITRAIKIDDGVKIVMKSNLIDTAAFDDNGYRICYNLLELYDGNWLAVLDFIKSIPCDSASNKRCLHDIEAKMLGYPLINSTNHNGSSVVDEDPEFEITLGPIQSRSYPSIDMAYEVLDKYSRSVGFTVSKVNTTFKQQTESQKAANEPKVIVRQYFNCTCHGPNHLEEKEGGLGSKRKNQMVKKNDCKFKCCAALTSTGEYVFRELRNQHNHPPQDVQSISVTKKLSMEHLKFIKAYHIQGLTVQEICSKLLKHHHIHIGVRKIYRVISSSQKKVKSDNGVGIELNSIHGITEDGAFSSHNHYDSSDCDA